MQGYLDNLDLFTLAVIFVTLIISITLHEMMHAFTSFWLGDDTAEREGRISFNPLRHVDLFTTILLPLITLILFKIPFLAAKPVPFNPDRVKFEEFGAALVGLAGPATNFLLAAAGAAFLKLFGADLGQTGLDILGIFVVINTGLFVFNMIPIPPLDGSRLLYAFAPEPIQRFMASLEQFGIFIILGLVLMVPAFGDLLSHLNSVVVDFLI